MGRTVFRALATTCGVAVWLCLGYGMAMAQTVAGSIIGLAGQVTLDRSGQRYTPSIGQPVYVDDTVQALAGGKLKLRMSDGSILSLASGSSMRIDSYVLGRDGSRRSGSVSVGQGLLRSVTAPAARAATFEVNTAVGVSGVRSTDWFVEAAPGYDQVAVLTGSAYLSSRSTGRSVAIPAGSGTRLEAGRDPAPPRPLSQSEFAALIDRTDGAAVPAPAAPAAGGYYSPPPGPYPYAAPGGFYAPPRYVPIPLPRDGHRDRGRRDPPPSRGSHPN
jgi:hypothetical protein